MTGTGVESHLEVLLLQPRYHSCAHQALQGGAAGAGDGVCPTQRLYHLWLQLDICHALKAHIAPCFAHSAKDMLSCQVCCISCNRQRKVSWATKSQAVRKALLMSMATTAHNL